MIIKINIINLILRKKFIFTKKHVNFGKKKLSKIIKDFNFFF